MSPLPKITDSRIYTDGLDDAAIFRINNETAVVQTLDLITPVLNDPYAFGAVAAANALSDIYAMGATPVFALNIVCFPVRSLPLSILEEVLRGGAEVAAKAGTSVAGGHSIEDNAPKYGMAVTGTCHPASLVFKKGARPGDQLFLTKPLGSGIITTAVDRCLASTDLEEKIYNIMVHLNRCAAAAMAGVGVNACTDVTGFGLLGHLHEMLAVSAVSARIDSRSIPIIDEAWEFARSGVVPAGSHNNYRYLLDKVSWSEKIPPEARIIQCDAQTSGGLLISVSPEKAEDLKQALLENGCLSASCIGEIIAGAPAHIAVS